MNRKEKARLTYLKKKNTSLRVFVDDLQKELRLAWKNERKFRNIVALAALQGLLSNNEKIPEYNDPNNPRSTDCLYAIAAFNYADAFIEESRKRGRGSE